MVTLLAANPLLRGVPQQALVCAAREATRQHLAAGESAFHEGDDACHCLLVVSGCVEVLRFGVEGDERVFHSFAPGSLVAEVAMFMPHGRYPMSARAGGVTVVWRLTRNHVRDACMQHPALALRLLESFSERLYRRANEIEWLTISTAQQRLAVYLLALAQRQGEAFELPVSQRQLATHMGIRAETLSRLLADWQRRGWISGERRRWVLHANGEVRALADASVRPF